MPPDKNDHQSLKLWIRMKCSMNHDIFPAVISAIAFSLCGRVSLGQHADVMHNIPYRANPEVNFVKKEQPIKTPEIKKNSQASVEPSLRISRVPIPAKYRPVPAFRKIAFSVLSDGDGRNQLYLSKVPRPRKQYSVMSKSLHLLNILFLMELSLNEAAIR